MESTMPEWDEGVYDLYYAIQRLSFRSRRKLWDLLNSAFPRVLDDTDPTPAEVWDDPENCFGKKETRVLLFLCEEGTSSERAVLRLLWSDEWEANVETETILCRRLRKLEQRIRDKLRRLKSDWVLFRPKQHQLALARSREWDSP